MWEKGRKFDKKGKNHGLRNDLNDSVKFTLGNRKGTVRQRMENQLPNLWGGERPSKGGRKHKG